MVITILCFVVFLLYIAYEADFEVYNYHIYTKSHKTILPCGLRCTAVWPDDFKWAQQDI